MASSTTARFVLDAVAKLQAAGERCPAVHTVGLYASHVRSAPVHGAPVRGAPVRASHVHSSGAAKSSGALQSTHPGERFLMALSAATGGSYQEYDPMRERVYVGGAFKEYDVSSESGAVRAERQWAEARLAYERRKNAKLCVQVCNSSAITDSTAWDCVSRSSLF
jgi:hypothetical protein